jgi:hypothetical protein
LPSADNDIAAGLKDRGDANRRKICVVRKTDFPPFTTRMQSRRSPSWLAELALATIVGRVIELAAKLAAPAS